MQLQKSGGLFERTHEMGFNSEEFASRPPWKRYRESSPVSIRTRDQYVIGGYHWDVFWGKGIWEKLSSRGPGVSTGDSSPWLAPQFGRLHQHHVNPSSCQLGLNRAPLFCACLLHQTDNLCLYVTYNKVQCPLKEANSVSNKNLSPFRTGGRVRLQACG